MKIITVTQAIPRFEWELEVLLTNLKSFEYDDIIILFCGGDIEIMNYIQKKYKVRAHFYEDNRPSKKYISSIRPYAWSLFLKEYPDMEHEDFFYIDTDIILREKIDFSKYGISSKKWLASDSSELLQPSTLKGIGEVYYKAILKIIGISEKEAESFEGQSGGAQWLISNPKQKFWEKVYHDSEKIYVTLFKIKALYEGDKKSNYKPSIHPWISDMWALLWNTAYFDIEAKVEPSLSFSWSVDDREEWYKYKILHNAGVKDTNSNLFLKSEWVDESPIGKDIEVNPNKCSYFYVEAINKVEVNKEN